MSLIQTFRFLRRIIAVEERSPEPRNQIHRGLNVGVIIVTVYPSHTDIAVLLEDSAEVFNNNRPIVINLVSVSRLSIDTPHERRTTGWSSRPQLTPH